MENKIIAVVGIAIIFIMLIVGIIGSIQGWLHLTPILL